MSEDGLGLSARAVDCGHSGADGASIGLHAFEQDLDPVVVAGDVVTQQRGRFVEIDDEDIEVAIVIEVAERATAAGMYGRKPAATVVGGVDEFPIPEISEQHARTFIRVIRIKPFDFRVNVPGDVKQVGPGIVVEIHQADTPLHVPGHNAKAGRQRNVCEVTRPIILVQHRHVISEKRFDHIERAIAIIIRHGDAHARLLAPVLAVGYTTLDGDIAERAVLVVSIQDAGSRVANDEQVRPAVIIKIDRGRSHAVISRRL